MPDQQLASFDVCIAGSGLYGSILASILSKQGLDVLLLEPGRHPRFSLGEALLPQSAIWPFMLSERYGVPEIGHLSHADRIVDHVTPSCGLKHSIGFAHHSEGERLDASRLQQLVPPHMPFYSESHLYREEVDHFMVRTAAEYGAQLHEDCHIEAVEFDEDGVTVSTSLGDFQAAYYVDASGRRSTLVDQLELREGAPESAHHARAIFAHVEGLQPMDGILESPSKGRRLHDGTFHHVFDGGWMWVIPFDNFERSTSNVASVGLMLDPRVHPERADLDAEAEFMDIVSRFPDMARHMEGIQAVRPFTRTDRLQYASITSVGDRFLLSPSTYGFIDALYSNGLVHTFESIHFAAHHLLSAFGKVEGVVKEGDFSAAAFVGVDRLHRRQWIGADRMITGAYKAMRDADTWRAWTQYWLAQVLFGDLWLQRACFHYFASGDAGGFDAFLEEERPGVSAPLSMEKRRLLDDLNVLLDEGAEAEALFARIAQEEWLPRHVYDWGNPEARSIDFSRPDVVGPLIEWGFTALPEALRKGLFDFPLPEAMA